MRVTGGISRMRLGDLLRAVLLVVLVVTLFSASHVDESDGHFSVIGKKQCRQVGHVPNSDILSTGIRVRRVSCGKVRYWIRRGQGSWDAVPSGWKCRYSRKRRGDRHLNLPHMDFKCVQPGWRKQFTWSATWRIAPSL